MQIYVSQQLPNDRITKIDELGNAGSRLLSGFQQALGSFYTIMFTICQ